MNEPTRGGIIAAPNVDMTFTRPMTSPDTFSGNKLFAIPKTRLAELTDMPMMKSSTYMALKGKIPGARTMGTHVMT
jgi:hypothetical protein